MVTNHIQNRKRLKIILKWFYQAFWKKKGTPTCNIYFTPSTQHVQTSQIKGTLR